MKKICIILFALVSLYLSGCGRELKLTGKEVVKAESVILKELEQNINSFDGDLVIANCMRFTYR